MDLLEAHNALTLQASGGLCHGSCTLMLVQGIKTARLPIREHLHMTGTHVLTINHVLSLLLDFQQSHDWVQALMAILPGRKGALQLAGSPEHASAAERSPEGSCGAAANHVATAEQPLMQNAEAAEQFTANTPKSWKRKLHEVASCQLSLGL